MAEKKTKSNLGITKAPKGVAGMGKLLSQGMSAAAAKNLLKKIRENKPRGRITQIDIEKYKMKMPRKMPNPKTPGTRMNKEPRKMPNPKDPGTRPTAPRTRKNPLGPVRPIRERSLSKLTSRRRATNKK
tara:strand:+ start:60 stop:446 length:387 start_codon:yes stop_codon:yes gene_type:complete